MISRPEDSKRACRALVSSLKAQMTEAEKSAQSESVWSRVENLESFLSARTILLYSSLPDELDTSAFIARWASSKKILLPVVEGENLVLKEYVPGRTEPGYRGIMEPDSSLPAINPSEVDLAIIPGVAFDATGGRLGRGKGFYDRLLPSLGCPTIGVCWACQLVPAVPADPHDIKVGAVIAGK